MAGAARQADTKAGRNGFSREFYVVPKRKVMSEFIIEK